MDSSKSTENDTISDKAESGYVSTRPRFTRARRTWKQNVRNLVIEDIRALDAFVENGSQRAANSFLYPNLLPNWSFEFPAPTAANLVFGWTPTLFAGQITPGVTLVTAEDGLQAIQFTTMPAQSVAAGATVETDITCDAMIPCTAGEVYLFNAQMNAVQGTVPSGNLIAALGVYFYNNLGTAISPFGGAFTITAGWSAVSQEFTIPAGAVSFQVKLFAQIHNTGGTSITLDGSASVTFDAVGCSLLTPVTPFGRMAGSSPLGAAVRFSKLPEIADIGWGNGVKVYGVNFELTEV